MELKAISEFKRVYGIDPVECTFAGSEMFQWGVFVKYLIDNLCFSRNQMIERRQTVAEAVRNQYGEDAYSALMEIIKENS